MKQVWFSPTGFGSKQDEKVVGYIELPHGVRLNEHKCRNYKLSVMSTKMYDFFKSDFNHVEQVEQVSVEHQKAFFPYLFIE